MKLRCRRLSGPHRPRWWVAGLGHVYRLRDAKRWARRVNGITKPGRRWDGPRFMLKTMINGILVSTVGDFWVEPLGRRIPIGFGGGFRGGFTEMWYETAIFGRDPEVEIANRYLTAAEARAGHAEVVAQVRNAQSRR